MIEKIGKITIDDTYYPGQDFYCDGTIEDEILEIVKENDSSSYGKIIEERKNWPVFYHLSHLRENIVNWIPVQKTDKVLEVGSGCGAITGALSAKAESVTCVELSKKRSMINAYRHPQCDNVTIKLGNFQDIEPHLACDYDYIFLIGVFEYAQSYIGGEKPFETFMAIMKKHLAPGGRLVIAIENRFGLKYWAGCKEDHLGTYFDGIEGYPNGGGVRTFTRKALEEICRENEITEYSFYYPYPDYKFMTTVYSDERLPKVGELSDNLRNFDRDRMEPFDEKNVFDSLIQEEMFTAFSNSYVLVIGKPLDVVYARFSNDRAPQYAIRTEIRKQSGAGEQVSKLEVRKIPMTDEAAEHVAGLEKTCGLLQRDYKGSSLDINRCRLENGEAVLEYLVGETLEEKLDACLERNDMEAFQKLFDRYCALVEYPANPSVYDFDLIFSNIIISGDAWNLIDYEWVSKEQIPAQELIARALYCYGLGSPKRKEISRKLLREKLGYGEEQIEEIIRKEKAFQKHATGNRMSASEIRDEIDYPVVPYRVFFAHEQEKEHRNRIQIYEDLGEGFSEENSYFLIKGYEEKKQLEIELMLKPELKAVRIDPSLDYCLTKVAGLSVDGQALTLKQDGIMVNGRLLSEDTIVFDTQDSNITITGMERFGIGTEKRLRMVLETTRISREMAESLAGTGKEEAEEKQGLRKGLAWFRK